MLNERKMACFTYTEIARDYLTRLRKHDVVAGIISPVHDAYDKKVSSQIIFSLIMHVYPRRSECHVCWIGCILPSYISLILLCNLDVYPLAFLGNSWKNELIS